MIDLYRQRKNAVLEAHHALLGRKNYPIVPGNGIFLRYANPVLTADHIPLEWRYDFSPENNPYFMERIIMNSTFNAGAIRWNGKFVLVVRVEGADRKSFFAFAESDNGLDNFRFRDRPLVLPQLEEPDVNVYDMRLTLHEDGWVYGVFCTEKRDRSADDWNQSAAVAQCGIIRSKDLERWERLPNLVSAAPQQRNVVLHPEFVNGKYAFYTRPQDGFIDAGAGGGIAFGIADDITRAVIADEQIIHAKKYHTVYEAKNGQGPAPIKTEEGWLHLAHGVRSTAAGLRYVLYLFMTSLEDVTRIIYEPGGYFLAPYDAEYTGDVGNVLFSNGWIVGEDGTVYIYYASSDTRMHVALSSVNQLVDYVKNTPADGFYSCYSVEKVNRLIRQNNRIHEQQGT